MIDARRGSDRFAAAHGRRAQTVGVVLLNSTHAVDTLDLDDPFAWVPPPGLGRGFFGHPSAWPVPALFAVAENATSAAAALGDAAASRGVADAVARLDGRCDLIVGACGFFAYAWEAVSSPPTTPTLLSGLDLLDGALRASTRDVAVLSFGTSAAERFLERRTDRRRLRAVGLMPAGDWPKVGVPSYATDPQWTVEGLEAGLREVLEAETRPGGAMDGIGSLVVECTVVPQFRSVLREYLTVPILDAHTAAMATLS
jgi:hypothetical protein